MASAARAHNVRSVLISAATSVRLNSRPWSFISASVLWGSLRNLLRNSSSVINRPMSISIIRCATSQPSASPAWAISRPQSHGSRRHADHAVFRMMCAGVRLSGGQGTTPPPAHSLRRSGHSALTRAIRLPSCLPLKTGWPRIADRTREHHKTEGAVVGRRLIEPGGRGPGPRSNGGSTTTLPEDLLREQSIRIQLFYAVGVALWLSNLVLDLYMSPHGDRGSHKLLIQSVGAALAAALALFARYSRCSHRVKADAGVAFIVPHAFLLALLNSWAEQPTTVRPISGITVLILLFGMLATAKPRSMLLAGLVAASMDPVGVWIAHDGMPAEGPESPSERRRGTPPPGIGCIPPKRLGPSFGTAMVGSSPSSTHHTVHARLAGLAFEQRRAHRLVDPGGGSDACARP
jgi:hypothetical protein